VPVISVFFGILVRLFHDDHNPPHFHVEYGERRAVIASVIEISTGKLLAGSQPVRVRRLVEEWRRLNVRRLRIAWADAQEGRQPRRIPPLE
jgi:hypothetical protein